MLLEHAGIKKRTVNAFAKKNIYTVHDLVCYFPKKYLDYRIIMGLNEAIDRDCAISGYLESFEKKTDNGRTIIGAEIMEASSGEKIYIKWYGQSWQFNRIRQFARKKIVICGRLIKRMQNIRGGEPVCCYFMNNPHSYHLRDNYKASIIVVNNAERFGLAQLHQLRGRVGRGAYQSYCILKSKERYNERLLTLERTSDGFEIAKADMQQRGYGDLIGTAQSGSNYYMDLIMSMPNLYKSVKKYADWMICGDMAAPIIHLYAKESGTVNK